MSRALVAITIALAVGATFGCGDDVDPVQTAAERAIASAVDVRASGCRSEANRGAGAAIEGGYILTAAHVVSGATAVTVRAAAAPKGPFEPVSVVAIDPVNDLALLATDTFGLPGLVLSNSAAGDVGVAIIFRDGGAIAQPYVVDKSVVVRMLDIFHQDTISRPGYIVDIEIAAGDSGAIMVSADGHAVGMLFAKSRESARRAFATNTVAVPTLLDSATAATNPVDSRCAG